LRAGYRNHICTAMAAQWYYENDSADVVYTICVFYGRKP
jgi:hypothetical protein